MLAAAAWYSERHPGVADDVVFVDHPVGVGVVQIEECPVRPLVADQPPGEAGSGLVQVLLGGRPAVLRQEARRPEPPRRRAPGTLSNRPEPHAGET